MAVTVSRLPTGPPGARGSVTSHSRRGFQATAQGRKQTQLSRAWEEHGRSGRLAAEMCGTE